MTCELSSRVSPGPETRGHLFLDHYGRGPLPREFEQFGRAGKTPLNSRVILYEETSLPLFEKETKEMIDDESPHEEK